MTTPPRRARAQRYAAQRRPASVSRAPPHQQSPHVLLTITPPVDFPFPFPHSGAVRITQQQIDQYLKHGYVIVPNFLTPTELSAARENMLRYVPTAEELSASPERYSWIYDDPEHLQTEFPFAGEALND